MGRQFSSVCLSPFFMRSNDISKGHSINRIKMQKSVISAKKNSKINMLKIKNIVKLGAIVIIQEYRGAAHNICDLKYSVLKGISIVFHNESKSDYNFIKKVLAEKF